MKNLKEKVGVSVNLFDGYDFLEVSLRVLRPFVDHINIVYQILSNNLALTDESVEQMVLDFYEEGLIDEYYKFDPPSVFDGKPQFLECKKREIGKQIAYAAGVNLFSTIDADEIYTPELLFNAVVEMKDGADVCFAPIWSFYKYPDTYYKEPETFKVPFLYRLNERSQFSMTNPRKDLVDLTRNLNYKTKVIAKVPMYHMSYIRDNIHSKFHASSNYRNGIRFYNVIKTAYDNFSPTSTKATILRNWHLPEEVEVSKTNIITNILKDYEWNEVKRRYTKRSK